MKKTLLASSALVGASLIAAPAMAGTVGSKDAMSVSLSGTLWFAIALVDEDVSAGEGRGYKFKVNETEVHVKASNTADNGIKYGVEIELNAGGSDATAADESYAFLDSDQWGRLELGDNDDASNRMQLGSWNAHKGLGGPLGGLGMILTGWEGLGGLGDTLIARADWQPLTSSDSTKMTYFTPRFAGFQLGASLTPDSGVQAGTADLAGETDNDGDFENTIGLGANYVGKFDEVGIGLSVVGEFGDDESASGADQPQEDLEIWGIGGKVDFAGFTFGAHWRDFGDTFLTSAATNAGADGGDQWSVGLGYQAGPWGVSVWYTNGERTTVAPNETEIQRLGFGAGYTVAPGWLLRADLEFLEHDNIAGTTVDNDGTGFLLTNMFIF